MALTTSQRKLAALNRNRWFLTGTAYLLFFLLTTGLSVINFWHRYERQNVGARGRSLQEFITGTDDAAWLHAFGVVLLTSLLYTLLLSLFVGFNLKVLKPLLLEGEFREPLPLVYYLLGAVASALIFAGMLEAVYLLDWLPILRLSFPGNAVIILALLLVSTGTIFFREINHKEREIQRVRRQKDRLLQELHLKEEELSSAEEELNRINSTLSVSKDHLKIGTKTRYKIIRFEDILYFQGDGNEPLIFTIHGKEYGSRTLMDYQDLLPNAQFMRIHKSYIIAKDKVIARRKNKFVLRTEPGEEPLLIPIGETYLERIDADSYLSFNALPIEVKN